MKQKRNNPDLEIRRGFPLLECRAETDAEGQMKITGYAAVFNSRSEPIWDYFIEQIAPGAFRKSIQEGDQVMLWDHDTGRVLGRVSSRTLTLTEDSKGLRFETSLPDNTWGHDAYESIRRGDVKGASFRFSVVKEEWAQPERKGDYPLRTLKEVNISEVSPTAFPAYRATEVEARSILESSGIEIETQEAASDVPPAEPESPATETENRSEAAEIHSEDNWELSLLQLRQKQNEIELEA